MSVSIYTHQDQENMHTINHPIRRDSDELGVFEAAGYFSAYNEVVTGTTFPQKAGTTRVGRLSLEIPTYRNTAQIQPKNKGLVLVNKAQIVKEISNTKYKQPSSPAGKLASFLNSLFNQNALKKKKPKSIVATKSLEGHHPINDVNDGDDDLRKKRSSISHFPSTSSSSISTTTINTNDSSRSSFYSSSSSSGFKTQPPPIHASTPTKGYVKDLRCYSKKSNASLDDKFKFSNTVNAILENKVEKHQNWVVDKCSLSEDRKDYTLFKKINDDDGAESDSSSDLFELKNCELGSSSSENLPVYETTKLFGKNNL